MSCNQSDEYDVMDETRCTLCPQVFSRCYALIMGDEGLDIATWRRLTHALIANDRTIKTLEHVKWKNMDDCKKLKKERDKLERLVSLASNGLVDDRPLLFRYSGELQDISRKTQAFLTEADQLEKSLIRALGTRNSCHQALNDFLRIHVYPNAKKHNNTRLLLKLYGEDSRPIPVADLNCSILMMLTVRDAWLVLHPFTLPGDLVLVNAKGEARHCDEVAWNGSDVTLYYTAQRVHSESLLYACRAAEARYRGIYPEVQVNLAVRGATLNIRSAVLNITVNESSFRAAEIERALDGFYKDECFSVPVLVRNREERVLRIT